MNITGEKENNKRMYECVGMRTYVKWPGKQMDFHYSWARVNLSTSKMWPGIALLCNAYFLWYWILAVSFSDPFFTHYYSSSSQLQQSWTFSVQIDSYYNMKREQTLNILHIESNLMTNNNKNSTRHCGWWWWWWWCFWCENQLSLLVTSIHVQDLIFHYECTILVNFLVLLRSLLLLLLLLPLLLSVVSIFWCKENRTEEKLFDIFPYAWNTILVATAG